MAPFTIVGVQFEQTRTLNLKCKKENINVPIMGLNMNKFETTL